MSSFYIIDGKMKVQFLKHEFLSIIVKSRFIILQFKRPTTCEEKAS